ncbi:lysine N-acyltransferase mbtK domain protein [Mycobacterium avium MAV_120709_2344]|nr:lysine N-acyltransferase mbtK domain protein [Mycobacterium avium MAV_120809_2495]ETZ41440.1 lysine N-acyltransferase mbtK domain protein [Mycobacterium avium MAV_120709_2344]
MAGGGSASGAWSDGPCARTPVACAGACGTSILSLPGGGGRGRARLCCLMLARAPAPGRRPPGPRRRLAARPTLRRRLRYAYPYSGRLGALCPTPQPRARQPRLTQPRPTRPSSPSCRASGPTSPTRSRAFPVRPCPTWIRRSPCAWRGSVTPTWWPSG